VRFVFGSTLLFLLVVEDVEDEEGVKVEIEVGTETEDESVRFSCSSS
jgi:hypothetical protein